jgi:hypothetical protein
MAVTPIEPTGYATDWAGPSAKHATPLPAYERVREQAVQARARRFPAQGDPAATRQAVLQLVDTPNPPLRLFLGEAPGHRGSGLRVAAGDLARMAAGGGRRSGRTRVRA